MYLYSVGMAISNLCTYRRMTEGPILIDPPIFWYQEEKTLLNHCLDLPIAMAIALNIEFWFCFL